MRASPTIGFDLVLLEQELDALGQFADHLRPSAPSSAARSSSAVASMPSFGELLRAPRRSSSQACSSALDGMQPTFRQVPPKRAALVDAGALQAQLARADGGVVAAGAAADDDDVEIVSHAVLPKSLLHVVHLKRRSAPPP